MKNFGEEETRRFSVEHLIGIGKDGNDQVEHQDVESHHHCDRVALPKDCQPVAVYRFVDFEVIVSDTCVKHVQAWFEKSLEVSNLENKVNSTNDGKHENKNEVQNNKVQEVSKHFLDNFDEWSYLSMELNQLNKSPKQAADINGVQVFKFEIDVLRNIRKLSESQLLLW